jgi:type IV secretion system protein VirD4
VLAAAAPTILLTMLLFGLFQVWRLRFRGRRRLTAPPGGAVRAVERGVTDNHGHTQWRSMADARKLFRGPHPLYGGIVVGEAYRVDQDRSVAGMRFDPRDERSWGMGGKVRLLIDPCTEGSGHSQVFAGPGGFKTTSAVSTVLTWTGSSVILDPSIELGPMLDGALRHQRKQIVHIGIPERMTAGRRPAGSTCWPGSTSPTPRPSCTFAAWCRGFTTKRRQPVRAAAKIRSSRRWAARW